MKVVDGLSQLEQLCNLLSPFNSNAVVCNSNACEKREKKRAALMRFLTLQVQIFQ
jgi:hypothetical protein